MFSTIGKKTRVIFWNLCSMEKFLVALALLFWGPEAGYGDDQTSPLSGTKLKSYHVVRLLLQFSEGGGGVCNDEWIGLQAQKCDLSRSGNL